MTVLAKEHFFRISNETTSRELFKVSVHRVMVETSSFCNRRCSYCPNAIVDRISSRNYMSDALRDKIAKGLAEIDYDGTIVFHFYNEPLADERICEQVAFFSQACPKAKLEMYSNGDYLNADYLKRLREAGLTSLCLSMHLGNDAEWDDAEIISRISLLSVKIGAPAKINTFLSGQAVLARFSDPKINITLRHLNYTAIGGSDRAGSLGNIKMVPKTAEQGYVCLIPFNEFYVAWDGSIVPCCDVHPDVPEHQKYKIGNLAEYPDIFSAYSNSTLVDWRRSLADPLGLKPPCDTCQSKCHSPGTGKVLHDFYSQHVPNELQRVG